MYYFFFFNDTATTEIYTLSLHDALPISIQLSLNSNKEKCSEATCNNPASLCFECVAKEVKDGIRLGEQKASKDLLKHTADNINENIRQAKQELWDDLQNKALTDKEWFKIKKRHNLK